MVSPQTLAEHERRVVAAWAADCAERVLPLFEREVAGDDRVRDAIARARAFARGDLDAAGEIRRRFVAFRAAGAATTAAGKAAARAAAHAAAVAHMGAHAMGAAGYAATSASCGPPVDPGASEHELEWQLEHLTAEARAALRRLPPLGENRSGPLGVGLLTSGALGAHVRALQAAVATEGGE
jgi:hypothetical protein